MIATTSVRQPNTLVVYLVMCALLTVACGAPSLLSSVATSTSPHLHSTLTPSVSRNGTCADTSLQLDQAKLYVDSTRRWSFIAEMTNRNAERVQAALICVTIRNPGSNTPIYEEWFAGTTLLGYETVPVRLLLQTTDIHSDAAISVFARTDQRPDAQQASQQSATANDDARSFAISHVTLHGQPPGPITIYGELRNTGAHAANNVHLAFALHGDDGALVGVADGQVTGLEPLMAGDSVSFTATTNLALALVSRYTWMAEGDVVDAP